VDPSRRSLRVFISSPDDVVAEREAARRVVRRLAEEFRNDIDLGEVMWEWRPMLADAHFQTQIPPPHDADVAVVVLWSKLGTPLPHHEPFLGPISRQQVKGTEWELEDAIDGLRGNGKPRLLV
jgi:hypothetical protein